jgi:hypothetical protein
MDPLIQQKQRFPSLLRIAAVLLLLAGSVVCAMLALPFGSTSAAAGAADPQTIRKDQMHLVTTTIGGTTVLNTTVTVPHWFGSTLDPNNGITYGYNMVGADPNNCSGANCDVTVTVDIIPLDVVVQGESFNGSETLNATLSSPVFALNSYGSTPFGAGPAFNPPVFYTRGPGGILSQNDADNQLQVQDAIQRAEFNKTGSSSYHLRLNPVVHDAITIVVPSDKGTVLQTDPGIQDDRGVQAGFVRDRWWYTRIQNLNASLGYIDPTHLPIYLTKDVVLYSGDNPITGCCSLGFHGAANVQHGNGSLNGNGNQPVQTFAWASYVSPGLFASPSGGPGWALQDIHFLGHEISEWANDPFVHNIVEPWSTATAPFYGCSNGIETGDPVVGIGFAMGTNIYFQGPNPDGSQSADGYYHPEDEAFLPWFLRLAPNNISEPTQSPSTNVGRYSFMGDLNPFPGFRQPATGCN